MKGLCVGIAVCWLLAGVCGAAPHTCSTTVNVVPQTFNATAPDPATPRKPVANVAACCALLGHKGTAVFEHTGGGNGPNATSGTCFLLGAIDHTLLVQPPPGARQFTTLDRNAPSPRSYADVAVAVFVGLYVTVAVIFATVSVCLFDRDPGATPTASHVSAAPPQFPRGAVGVPADAAAAEREQPLLSLPGPVPRAPGTMDSRPSYAIQQQRALPTGIDDNEIPLGILSDGHRIGGGSSLPSMMQRSVAKSGEEDDDSSDSTADREHLSGTQTPQARVRGVRRVASGAFSSMDELSDAAASQSQSHLDPPPARGKKGRRSHPRHESHPLFDKRTGAEYTKKYRFIRKLGEGVSSQVYLVRLRGSYAKRQGLATNLPPELMAMKVMECATDEELQAAFTEYMAMKRLQGHPHIVELLDMTMATEDLPPDVLRLQAGSPGAGGRAMPARNYSNTSSMGDLCESPDANEGLLSRGSTTSGQEAGSSSGGGHTSVGFSRSRFSAQSFGSSYGDEPNSPGAFNRSRATAPRTAFTCLLMRFYPEGTLEAGIANDPAFFKRPSVVVTYTHQLLSALAFSHSHDIAHFDLKPANVLLQQDRQAIVVSDFGLARTMKKDDAATATAAAATAALGGSDAGGAATEDTGTEIGGGTLFYQAPEQLERRSVLRSDVWGAACTIVAMAAGRVGTHTIPMFYWRAEGDFDAMVRSAIAGANLPPPFVALLLDMLAERPQQRPRMEECLFRLERFAPPELGVDTPPEVLAAAAAAVATQA